jgi:hypothetical protein
MQFMIVTNNPQVAELYPDCDICSVAGPVLSLYLKTRDLIHAGHRLLSHPLSGSLKPGRIPYKTVLLTAEKAALDLDSLRYIENSIAVYHKTALKSPVSWTAPLLADYAAIDLSHVEAALESIHE